MAYLDLHDSFPTRQGTHLSAPAARPPATGFSALEWSVIAFAERDGVRSLEQPGRVSRAMGSLFGLRTPSPLADPRLEALRRLAVLAWRHGFALPAAEIERFLSAGFVEAQIETLVDSITRHIGKRGAAA
jgi:hypothetical protein